MNSAIFVVLVSVLTLTSTVKAGSSSYFSGFYAGSALAYYTQSQQTCVNYYQGMSVFVADKLDSNGPLPSSDQFIFLLTSYSTSRDTLAKVKPFLENKCNVTEIVLTTNQTNQLTNDPYGKKHISFALGLGNMMIDYPNITIDDLSGLNIFVSRDPTSQPWTFPNNVSKSPSLDSYFGELETITAAIPICDNCVRVREDNWRYKCVRDQLLLVPISDSVMIVPSIISIVVMLLIAVAI